MKYPIYGLFQQLDPRPTNGFEFRLLETNMTCDGPRTRVCDVPYKTIEQAEMRLKELRDARPR